MVDLSAVQIGRVEGLLMKGASYREIREKTGVSLASICKIKKKIDHGEDATSSSRKRCGRKKKTTRREDGLIARTAIRNRSATLESIKIFLIITYAIHLSTKTIAARLKNQGIFHCRKTKKFLLNRKMMQKRSSWAFKHRTWRLREWSNVKFF